MSHLPSIVFWFLSAIFIATAICVVTLRSVFYSAVSLGAALTVMAGLFILFGADFLGVAQVLVYVGGVMIIMLFVIMLSPQTRDHLHLERQTRNQWLRGVLLALASCVSLIHGFRVFAGQSVAVREMLPTSAPLGRLLLGDMLLPFETVSLILLVALVGAVLFGQDKLS
jgi:NADH-quinone oxidoreductase subunit J